MFSIVFNPLLTLVLLWASFTASGLAAAPIPSEKSKWIKVASAHFSVYTDCPEDRARDLATDFETLREVLCQITPSLRNGHLTLNSPRATSIYLFGKEEEFHRFLPVKTVAGFFQGRPDGNYIALRADCQDDRLIAYHEYLHYFVDTNFHGTPVWLNEGLAEYYSTLQVLGHEVALGKSRPDHLRLLANRAPMGMAEITGLTTVTSCDAGEERRGLFYSSSWLVAHYLFTKPERRVQLGRYLELIRAGVRPDAAFPEAFGCEPIALDSEILEYRAQMMRYFRYTVIRLSELVVDKRCSVSPISHDEAMARIGLLYLFGPARTDQRLAEQFRAALAENPACATALFGQALLKHGDGLEAEAALLFAKAARTAPKDPFLLFCAAESAFHSALQKGGFPTDGSIWPEMKEAKELVSRSLDLDPARWEALHLLLRILDVATLHSAEGIPPFERAMKLDPHRLEIKEGLAILKERAGMTDQALALFKELVSQQEQPAVAKAARLRLESLDTQGRIRRYNAALALAKAGKRQEAIQSLEEALKDIRESSAQTPFTSLLKRLKNPQ